MNLTALATPAAGAQVNQMGSDWFIFDISGTWVGTITFQQSLDGVNFSAVSGDGQLTPFPTGTPVATTTTNGRWYVAAQAGVVAMRAVFTQYTSGTAVVLPIAVNGAIYLTRSVANFASNAIQIQGVANKSILIRKAVVSYNTLPSSPSVLFADGPNGTVFTNVWNVDMPAAIGPNNVPLPDEIDSPAAPSAVPSGWPDNIGGLQFLQGSDVIVTAGASASGSSSSSGSNPQCKLNLEVRLRC